MSTLEARLAAMQTNMLAHLQGKIANLFDLRRTKHRRRQPSRRW